MAYAWITFAQLRAVLAQRLADTGNQFWADAELGAYIWEALRTWNAFTAIWTADFAFTAPLTNGQIWYSVPALTGSPRARTVTDTSIYTMMEYHLLEPATGGTWTGSPQFSISDLAGALQRRRDEILQATGVNLTNGPLATTPGIRRTILPDTTLEVRRARWIPTIGTPNTLRRSDALAFEYFEPNYLQTNGTPEEYNVMSDPPLSFDVDVAPNTAGSYDLVTLQSGVVLAPPTATVLELPDDWCWLAKWAALSDLLGRDSEATDLPRADYCRKRYDSSLKLMQMLPWLFWGSVNNVPVDTASVYEMDSFAVEWDSTGSPYPAIVTAGVDFMAVAPVPPTTATPVGVGMMLVGNAPVPVLDGEFVQVSRDQVDVILDYAQHIAAFKMGGAEFLSTKPLYDNFITAAAATNSRIGELGIFRDLMLEEGQRQDENQPRYKEAMK